MLLKQPYYTKHYPAFFIFLRISCGKERLIFITEKCMAGIKGKFVQIEAIYI